MNNVSESMMVDYIHATIPWLCGGGNPCNIPMVECLVLDGHSFNITMVVEALPVPSRGQHWKCRSPGFEGGQEWLLATLRTWNQQWKCGSPRCEGGQDWPLSILRTWNPSTYYGINNGNVEALHFKEVKSDSSCHIKDIPRRRSHQWCELESGRPVFEWGQEGLLATARIWIPAVPRNGRHQVCWTMAQIGEWS